jgi:hypothetical protein
MALERVGFARRKREWPLNEAQHPLIRVGRVALGTSYCLVRGIGRASPKGPAPPKFAATGCAHQREGGGGGCVRTMACGTPGGDVRRLRSTAASALNCSSASSKLAIPTYSISK